MCSSPCFQAFYLTETSFYAAEVSGRSLWSSPCCRKLHRIRNLNRINTCNSNTSTKVSGLQIYYLFLCLQCIHTFSRNCKKFHSILGTNSSKQSKNSVSKHPSKDSQNSNKLHWKWLWVCKKQVLNSIGQGITRFLIGTRSGKKK